jgi:hypothetical protein
VVDNGSARKPGCVCAWKKLSTNLTPHLTHLFSHSEAHENILLYVPRISVVPPSLPQLVHPGPLAGVSAVGIYHGALGDAQLRELPHLLICIWKIQKKTVGCPLPRSHSNVHYFGTKCNCRDNECVLGSGTQKLKSFGYFCHVFPCGGRILPCILPTWLINPFHDIKLYFFEDNYCSL